MSCRLTRQAVIVCLLAAAAACKTRHGDDGADVKIFGGAPLVPDHPGLVSAVGIARKGQPACTGTLIAKNVVLTAAHCLIDADQHKRTRVADLGLYFGTQFSGEQLTAVNVVETGIHPKYDLGAFAKGKSPARASGISNDVGWIRFTGLAPAGKVPIPIIDADSLVHRQKADLVGYGFSQDDNEDKTIRIGRLLGAQTYYNATRVCASDRNLIGYGPEPDIGLAGGDSGGPGFVRVDGAWLLASVHKGKVACIDKDSGTLGDAPTQTKVSPFLDWLNTSLAGKAGPFNARVARGERDFVTVSQALLSNCKDKKAAAQTQRAFVALRLALNARDCDELAASAERVGTLEIEALDDLWVLSHFPNLSELTVTGTKADDFTPLARLFNLEKLTITDGKAFVMRDAPQLAKLSELSLANFESVDQESLIGLPSLVKLSLVNDRIEGAGQLGELKTVEELTLDGNRIEELGLIALLPRLRVLSIARNKVTDLQSLGASLTLALVVATDNPLRENVCPANEVANIRCIF